MFDFLHFVSLSTFLYQSYTIHIILTHPAIFGMVLDHISYTKNYWHYCLLLDKEHLIMQGHWLAMYKNNNHHHVIIYYYIWLFSSYAYILWNATGYPNHSFSLKILWKKKKKHLSAFHCINVWYNNVRCVLAIGNYYLWWEINKVTGEVYTWVHPLQYKWDMQPKLRIWTCNIHIFKCSIFPLYTIIFKIRLCGNHKYKLSMMIISLLPIGASLGATAGKETWLVILCEMYVPASRQWRFSWAPATLCKGLGGRNLGNLMK